MELSKDEIFAPLRHQVFITLLISALLFFIVFFLVILFGRRYIRQLRTITKSVEKFSAADFTEEVPVLSKDELGSLSLSFNRMAAELRVF